jgi:hypothetical protein
MKNRIEFEDLVEQFYKGTQFESYFIKDQISEAVSPTTNHKDTLNRIYHEIS